MKFLFSAIIAAGLFSISTTAISANPQNAAEIIKDKAISYAIHSEKNANFDIKMASRELSQNAIDLGKIYGSSYQLTLNDITSEQCLEELTKLSIDSDTFINKAMEDQYKTLVNVDGNKVMLIAGGAGKLTYFVIDQGGYCTIDKSIHDAYWAANIIRLGIDSLNIIFS